MSAYSIATRGLAGRKIPQGVLAAINTLLFGSSEQGAWYDPSDLSTLFQDTAGTTPVTAVEQAVALMLDKSGRGNHASQATSTKRPKYSRRVNLLTKTEQFDDAIWQKGSAGIGTAPVVTPNAAISPLGDMTADSVYFTLNGGTAYADRSYLTQSFASSIGTAYTAGVSVKANGPTDVGKKILLRHAAGGGYTVITLSNEWQAVSSTETAIGATAAFLIELRPQSGGASDTCTVDIWGARAQLAIDAHLPYQRVNTPTDYDADPAKFPGYLRFDGVDDALSTGSIDFTGTDKMTVWAGVTKLSDAATGMLAELSTGLGGSFYVAAPQGAAATYNVRVGGTTLIAATSPANYAAPITSVLTGIGDTSGDSVILRINGSQVAANALDQGTGNYGNYPMYIGARAGTSLFFNGRLYSLIARGAQSSLSQIEATELYIKRKMRLP